jgi:hypothetical protein
VNSFGYNQLELYIEILHNYQEIRNNSLSDKIT